MNLPLECFGASRPVWFRIVVHAFDSADFQVTAMAHGVAVARPAAIGTLGSSRADIINRTFICGGVADRCGDLAF